MSHREFGQKKQWQRGGSSQEPPTIADIEVWISTNPTRELLPPTRKPASRSASAATVDVPGPWPDTKQFAILKAYPYTSSHLWVTDYTWRNMDAAGKQRTCEESCNALYLGWADIYKERNYKLLGWKATDIEQLLANTRADPTDERCLHTLSEYLGAQFMCVNSDKSTYTMVPTEWNPTATHVVIVDMKNVVVPAQSDTWTLPELAAVFGKLALDVQPSKKELATLTAADLKSSCADANIELKGRATKESMWIALKQYTMQQLWESALTED